MRRSWWWGAQYKRILPLERWEQWSFGIQLGENRWDIFNSTAESYCNDLLQMNWFWKCSVKWFHVKIHCGRIPKIPKKLCHKYTKTSIRSSEWQRQTVQTKECLPCIYTNAHIALYRLLSDEELEEVGERLAATWRQVIFWHSYPMHLIRGGRGRSSADFDFNKF